MRILRLYAAVAILRGAAIVAGVIAGPDLEQPRPAMHPAERMLIASLVGMFVAFLWIWIAGRAEG